MGSNREGKSTDLGERRIIDIIARHLEPMPNLPVPFGDDVSAVSLDQKQVAVLKTDMLVGKTDVPPNMSLWQAARKAVVMNISDFASKGVQPIAALVALGLPGGFMQKDIEEIARGLNAGREGVRRLHHRRRHGRSVRPHDFNQPLRSSRENKPDASQRSQAGRRVGGHRVLRQTSRWASLADGQLLSVASSARHPVRCGLHA